MKRVKLHISSPDLPSLLLRDGSSTGPTVLWKDNSEMAAIVEMVFIYNKYIWGKSAYEL